MKRIPLSLIAASLPLLGAGCALTSEKFVQRQDQPAMPGRLAARATPAAGNRIVSLDWHFDRHDRAFAETVLQATDTGEYRVRFDFAFNSTRLNYTSDVFRLAAAGPGARELGPFPAGVPGPAFDQVFIALDRRTEGGWRQEHLIDTFFLRDSRRVNDAALRELGIRGTTARELLEMYAPLLKTDVTPNPRAQVFYIEHGPKNIEHVLAAGRGSTNASLLRFHDGAGFAAVPNPGARDLLACNADKDLAYLDLAEAFNDRFSHWRDFVGGLTNTVYARAVLDDVHLPGLACTNALILQYWLPWYVNHLALLKIDPAGRAPIWDMGNYHEGEVENISIVLVPTDGTLVPALAGYAKHFKGSVTPWENVRKYMDETRITRHPVVYVASGSHASFFSPCAVETPFGLGIDRTYHEGAGYWFGLDAGDATYSLEVLPAVDEVGPDDSFGWLRFRGRYGDTFLVSGGSWLNCSPFLFPYVRYPRISLRAPWIAGSGANRWIDPGSELEFCAAFGLLLGYDLAPLPFRVDTHRLAVRRAGADIHLTGIDVEYGQAFPMPLEEIRFYYQAQNGDWLSCGRYDPRREPPPELVVPASNVNGQTTRFFVCDAISTAVQRKPPLPPDAHYGTAEYLRSAQFSVALNGLATVAPAPQAATPEPIGEAVPQGIERLAITGPPLLPGGGTAHYRCLAFYTGDRVADATRQALWNLGENPVAGTTLLTNALTAGFVLSNTPVRVTAVYANKMAACDVMLTGADADRDGLSDQYEAHKGTSPNNPDTDGDGIYDAQDPKPQ